VTEGTVNYMKVHYEVIKALSDEHQEYHLAGSLLGLLFDPEDRGVTFLRNPGRLLPNYTTFET
jgi:hypothetical protein